jgi:hypothetical protein
VSDIEGTRISVMINNILDKITVAYMKLSLIFAMHFLLLHISIIILEAHCMGYRFKLDM